VRGQFKAVIDKAADWLRKQEGSPKILCKITQNLGDTLHGKPILMHYRTKYPDAAIVFLCRQTYHGAHEFTDYIDKIFTFPNDITTKDRLDMWPYINMLEGIDIKLMPSIHPFGAVYPENAWSHSIITDQYLANAGITDRKPLAGRRYRIYITDADRKFADDFLKKHNLNPDSCVIVEYHSYSHPVPWRAQQWSELIKACNARFISIAGKNESLLSGTIDGRGLSWRQTVALLERVPKMIGIGSGITMLAAGCENQPQIYEINVPPNITMEACGYADSISIRDATPVKVKGVMGL
jgi:hypothetical protein